MPTAEPQNALVKQLVALINGGQAHATVQSALADLPEALRGLTPHDLPYSAWQLLEHLRITQRDILDFSAPPAGGYQPRKWPAEYWPESAEPPTSESWDHAIATLETDREAFVALLTSPHADMYTPFAWGDGQNLLREALLLADHNSYHTGELIVLRRLLGAWKS